MRLRVYQHVGFLGKVQSEHDPEDNFGSCSESAPLYLSLYYELPVVKGLDIIFEHCRTLAVF